MYRKMMLTFFLIIVLTVSVLVANFYSRTAGDLKRQAVETSERAMQQSAVAFNSYLENVRGFSWSNFRDFEFQKFVQSMGSNPDALSKYKGDFTIYVNDNPMVWSITVDQINGFSLRAGNAIPDMLPEEKERIARIAIEASGKGVWVPSTIYGLNSDQMEQTLTFAQAVRSISLTSPGPIIGVMMYNLSFHSLDQWFKKVEGDQSNRTYIVKATDGTIVHSLVPEERGESLLSSDDLKSVMKAKGGHFYSRRDFGSALVLYEKLERSDWMLVTMMPVKLLIKPVNDFTKSTLVIGSLSLLFSLLLAGLFYSRTITPLKELSKGMKAIEVGNYEVSLPVRSYDELGYITSSFNRMAKEINRLIMKVYESEIIKKNAEIKSLQSQINPHFLYNTLGIIDSLSAIDGDARISFISRSLAKMFRYNISGEDISTMETEIQQIRLYLSIQKIRFDEKFDYLIYVEPGLEQAPIPKMLLQPIVENSILHGVSRSRHSGIVRIEATMEDGDSVQVKIWNNGMPIDSERQEWLRARLAGTPKNGESVENRSSIGLLNVQARIRLLYGDDCGVSFESSSEYGTTFTLTLRNKVYKGGNEG
ncbi:cache domain-containing sensor histidine kinase [Paenibacillus sacheonensis]|nr:sensor histidine kinase [Paenibacillus sacheonensis]MBM7565096.1 two-component system sensor histidine kinase YesM [Paenibacillus sacheonensis]